MKDWSQILTALIAIYGAILSTINLYYRKKEKERTIKVKITNGFLSYPQGLSSAMLFIEARNTGYVSINLNSHGIILPDKRTLVCIHPESNVTFPYNLPPGENCQIWTDLKKLCLQLNDEGFKGKVTIMAFYRDGTGKEYKSNKFKINISMWIKDEN